MNVCATEALRQGLREHGGYVEGQNIAIEDRFGDVTALGTLSDDPVRLNVDVIVAGPSWPPSERPAQSRESARTSLIL